MNGWPVDLAALVQGRWRRDLPRRVGCDVPPVQPGSIWIHGASLGEVAIGRRLAAVLPSAFVTADTDAGCTLADSPRPWDHPWTLAPLWAEARPRMVVFVEGSWWPALAAKARAASVPVVAVAARFHRRRRWMHEGMGWPDAVWAASQQDVTAFQHHMRWVRFSGSLKGFDGEPSPFVFAGSPLVGACTHAPEEVALVAAWRAVMPQHPLVLAPRRLERVAELLHTFPEARRRSALRTGQVVGEGELVVLDTFGELGAVLQGAKVAFVGGTFDGRIGGHSPMEARAGGAVVVHGPEIANNREGFEGSVGIGSLAELPEGLRRALTSQPVPVVDRVARVARELLELAGPPAAEASPRPWARPVALAHRAKVAVRARTSLPNRVLAVGSRNARGAGKSTLTAFVAQGLVQRGVDVVVVTRGVGARVAGGDSQVHGADAVYLGDEGAWLASLGLRVLAGPWQEQLRRLSTRVDCVILEDGLQAGQAPRSVEIVDGRFPGARGPFPMGEDRGRCGAPDVAVWVRKSPEGSPEEGVVSGSFRQGAWSAEPAGRSVAFAGIGRNADFFATLQGVGLEATRGFRDHHVYTRDERRDLLCWAGGRTLLTTTRDALRLPRRFAVVHRAVHLDVPDFPWARVLPDG